MVVVVSVCTSLRGVRESDGQAFLLSRVALIGVHEEDERKPLSLKTMCSSLLFLFVSVVLFPVAVNPFQLLISFFPTYIVVLLAV